MDGKKVVLVFVAVTMALCIVAWLVSRTTPDATASTHTPDDKWNVSEDRSPMDDSKTVVLSLDSDNTIDGPLGSKRPTLLIRCQEGKTEAYIDTGMAASVEQDFEGGPLYTHTVRLRLDQGDALTEHWGGSTNDDALFSDGDQIAFTKELADAQTLTFEFTPFDANPAIARFDLRNLSKHLPQLGASCGWRLN